jgi:hypothetical protein
VQQKEFSITQPDGSTRIGGINASFELNVKKVPRKEAKE